MTAQPRRKLVMAGLAALLAAGCGSGGPETHSVTGTVRIDGGDASVLAGGAVEGALEGDKSVRASGEIKPDGSFRLETLQNGAIVAGARQGTFQVRIILPDDDATARKAASKAVAKKYLSFDSSGLSFKSPTQAPVTLNLAKP